jgi:hypothetical protein
MEMVTKTSSMPNAKDNDKKKTPPMFGSKHDGRGNGKC